MTNKASDNYTFAAVPYANAAPLAHFMEQACPGTRVIYAPPAELTALLLSGKADAAMIPTADFLTTGELQMIPGLGICADGQVWSVLLKCRAALDQVRTVAADKESRTSNALAAVLLEHHLHLPVQMIEADPDEEADAAVMIGDRALCSESAEAGDVDLAALWKEMTGLPFVFAVWAHRRDHANPQALARIARAAKNAGAQAINELADIIARRLRLSRQRCRDYLATIIYYDLGPREREAMDLFGQFLREAPAAVMAAAPERRR